MAIAPGQLRLGPHNGQMLLRTGRKGVGSAVGHDLTIEVTDWSADVDVPAEGAGAATVTAKIGLGSLAVREGTGGAKPLSDKDRREIVDNARRTLDTHRHPTATFTSTRVSVDGDRGTISGTFTLHGTERPLEVAVHEQAPGRYRATAVVTQSAYGIKPYSAFLGALKVHDDVQVEVVVDTAG